MEVPTHVDEGKDVPISTNMTRAVNPSSSLVQAASFPIQSMITVQEKDRGESDLVVAHVGLARWLGILMLEVVRALAGRGSGTELLELESSCHAGCARSKKVVVLF